MRSLVSLCLFLVIAITTAQDPGVLLSHTLDTLHANEPWITEAPNGDIVMINASFDAQFDTDYVFFRRSDVLNNEVSGSLYRLELGYSAYPAGIVALNNGDFMAAVIHDFNALLMRFDANGQIIDVREHPENTNDFYRNLIRLNDSTILGLGETDDFDMLVTRFDGAGEAVVSHAITVDGHGGQARFTIPSASGGYWICAHGQDHEDTVGTSPNFRTCLLRFDANSELLWAKRYMVPGFVTPSWGLVELPSGSVLIGREVWDVGSGSKPALLKVDAQGVPLFSKIYGDAQDTLDYLYTQSFGLLHGNDVWMHGMCGHPIQLTSIRFDTSGVASTFEVTPEVSFSTMCPMTTSWNEAVLPVAAPSPYGGRALGVVHSPFPLELPCSQSYPLVSDTLPVVVGEGFTITPFTMDFETVTDLFTPVPCDLFTFDPCSTTDLLDTFAPTRELQVWPNPASERVTIFGDDLRRIELIDAMGRLVAVHAATSANTEMDVRMLVPGLYHVRILQGNTWSVLPLIKE